ncbi:GGDEF domain-containing protein [Methylophaga sp. UBA2689]|uniref:GGDEF domain-containing protein n=1 Tax=Methylophaga sp. UBA2689 TaxID=1946878 RepID=UPI0025F947CA|nr:GGDEF domain-containing protein [Methylophaga sp. UBA2689]
MAQPNSDHPVYIESVLNQKVKMLFSGIIFSITISAFLGLVLVVVQQPIIPLTTSLSWYGTLMSVVILRLILFNKWQSKDAKPKHDQKRWLQYFRFSVLITGIIWGVGGVVMMPEGNISHQAFVSFTIGGLAAGAMASLSVDRISVTAFVLPTLFPHIIFLFQQGETISLGMSSMLLLFTLFVFLSAKKTGETFLENAKLHIQALENESRLRMMLDFSPIAASIIDITNQEVVFANKSYTGLIENKYESAIGITPRRYYANKVEYDDAVKIIERGEQITNQLVELNFDGAQKITKWVLASYLQIDYHSKQMMLGWFYDITDRKVMEEHTQHLAHHDPLTGLPNRILFRERLHLAISMAERDKYSLALMFIDLDEFKPINDTYGHDVGDAVLLECAARIRACLRKPDSVARLGGDEFVVLLHKVSNEQTALQVGEKILKSLQSSMKIEGVKVSVGASIGVALYPLNSTEDDELLNCADSAMYDAKKNGRNIVKLFQAAHE